MIFLYCCQTIFLISIACDITPPNITVYTITGLQITVPVVSDMSSTGNSIDDCSSGSGGGSPDADADATGSEEIGEHLPIPPTLHYMLYDPIKLYRCHL